MLNHFIQRWSEYESQVIMVDPNSDVYVVSNVQGGRGLFVKLPRTAWGNTAPTRVTSNVHLNMPTHHHDPLSGDISVDGTEILMKGRTHMYYWHVPDKNYTSAVTSLPVEVSYKSERQGQAVCWSLDAQAYYTVGEGHYEPLYKYTRLPSGQPGVIG